MEKDFIWCQVASQSPRKFAHPEPAASLDATVTLGHGLEDRIVNAQWRSGDMNAQVSVSVSTLRKMLAIAEAYKPGATL